MTIADHLKQNAIIMMCPKHRRRCKLSSVG
jgi:hypothetical protein